MIDIRLSLPALEGRLDSLRDDLPSYDIVKIGRHCKELISRMEHVVRNAGKGGCAFKRHVEELRTAIWNGRDVVKVMSSSAYIRPMLAIWLDDPSALRDCPPSERLLRHMDGLAVKRRSGCLGSVAMLELCQVFHERYLALGKDVASFGRFVQAELRRRPTANSAFGLKDVVSCAACLFTADGHRWLAEESGRRGVTIADMVDILHIPCDSEMHRAALGVFILERVRRLGPNQDDEVLDEVCDSRTYEIALDGTGRRIGHAVVGILIDTLEREGVVLEDRWKGVIIGIAGDPRLTELHADCYTRWWSVIGEHRMELMRSWLSRFDMELFLMVLEEFSRQNYTMKQMFPERKRLLEHIFKYNNVSMTRLFIGSDPLRFMRSKFNKNNMPFFTELHGDCVKTVFYYRIGHVHIVEGTHSFAMRLLTRLPRIRCVLRDYGTSMVTIQDVSTGLDKQYQREFGYDGFEKIIHSKGVWHFKAIRSMQRLGIVIHEDELLDKQQYIAFHGVSSNGYR